MLEVLKVPKSERAEIDYAAFTGLGAVFGARLAPWLSRHTDPITLEAIFAAIAIGDGILLVVQYIAMH